MTTLNHAADSAHDPYDGRLLPALWQSYEELLGIALASTPPLADLQALGIGGLAPVPVEFLHYAYALHANGWAPLPIGRIDGAKPDKPAGKVPWLKGLHGFGGTDAEPEIFDLWLDRIARLVARHGASGVLNLGVRCPPCIIGIDVDQYAGKHGLTTLAGLEAQWGPLPPTYRITARPYETGSGVRLYRIPDDWRWPGDFDDIEIIDRHHRVIAVSPSIYHTGSSYRLYGAGGHEITPGVLPTGGRGRCAV